MHTFTIPRADLKGDLLTRQSAKRVCVCARVRVFPRVRGVGGESGLYTYPSGIGGPLPVPKACEGSAGDTRFSQGFVSVNWLCTHRFTSPLQSALCGAG